MSEKLNQKGPVPGPDRQMLRRTLFLMAVCGVAVFLALLARLWKIQIVDHDFYQQLALSQQLRQVPGSAARGTIYDAKGNVLAVSASVDTVYLSLPLYQNQLALLPAMETSYSQTLGFTGGSQSLSLMQIWTCSKYSAQEH